MPLHMFTDTSALTIQEAIRRFWRGELRQAYGCACHVTSVDKVDLQVSRAPIATAPAFPQPLHCY